MTSKQDQTASPSRFPVFRLAGLVLATAGVILGFELWRVERNPLQAFYLATYAKLIILPDLTKVHIGIKRGIPQSRSFLVEFAGETVATTATLPDFGPLTTRTMNLDPKAFQAWLKQYVFEGQTLTDMLRWKAYCSLPNFLLLYLVGRHLDRHQLGRSRKGLLLRGPALISRYRFNRKTRGDGLAFRLENRRNLLIFDPDREYIQEFFREERGDWVLNPKMTAARTGRSAKKRRTKQTLHPWPMASFRKTPPFRSSSSLTPARSLPISLLGISRQ
jgi:hypothetical protein